MGRTPGRVAYLDPVCGISGDMFVACFLDAGLDIEVLREGLTRLGLAGYEISSTKVKKSSIAATRFSVDVQDPQREHRNLRVIVEMIERSGLPRAVKDSAVKTFKVLAQAEGEVHGIAPDRVTFHEVGAVDSIVDIVAAAIAMDEMRVDSLLVGPLPAGHGSVGTAHGRLPVPAPATAKLLKGFDLIIADMEGELVTPTGAAIAKAHGVPHRGRAPAMRLDAVGNGAGARDYEGTPNIARIFLGEARDEAGAMRPVDVIETTVDDASPQVMGYLVGKLLHAGAYDAFLTPVIMKKSRPGVLLTVLAAPGDSERLVELVFSETPTLGVRVSKQVRYELERRFEKVSTRFGQVPVKVSVDAHGRSRGAPEYEACAMIASEQGVPLGEVWEEARSAWERSQAR